MSRKKELQILLPMKLDQSQTYKDLIHCTYSAIFLKLMEQKLLYKMNLIDMFDKLYARDTIPFMKPYIESFKFIEQDIKKYYNNRNKYYFFDDRLDNLQTAKTRGWITIWVNIDFLNKPYYVDYSFPNIHTAVMNFVLDN